MTTHRDYYVLSTVPVVGSTVKVLAGPLLTLTHARGACARVKRGGIATPVIILYWTDRRHR